MKMSDRTLYYELDKITKVVMIFSWLWLWLTNILSSILTNIAIFILLPYHHGDKCRKIVMNIKPLHQKFIKLKNDAFEISIILIIEI